MYSSANPIRDHVLYVNQSWFGVQGLYPTDLNLKEAGTGASINYMDIRVVMSVRYRVGIPAAAPVADFETYLYSKHLDGPFQALRLVRYPPITSMLAWQAKYNILTTEFHRIRRRVTNQANIWCNLGRIIADLLRKGYQIGRLMGMLSRLMHQYGPGHFMGQPILYVRQIARHLAQYLHTYGMQQSFTTFLQQRGFLA